MTPTLPAHYDHVGSFLRPLALLEAREQQSKGQITAAALRLVEDQAISDIVKFQQDVRCIILQSLDKMLQALCLTLCSLILNLLHLLAWNTFPQCQLAHTGMK